MTFQKVRICKKCREVVNRQNWCKTCAKYVSSMWKDEPTTERSVRK